ncbi:MAG: hypothetical protein AAF211_28460 [Myxococcota bacterium]
MSRAREARERLGDAGILSLDHAATLLPLPNAEAKAWLREHDLVVEIAGRPTVDWGEVREERRRLVKRLTLGPLSRPLRRVKL